MEDATVVSRGTEGAAPFVGETTTGASTTRTSSSYGGGYTRQRPFPESLNLDPKRELENLKEKGFYKGPGIEQAEKAEVDRPIQIIKETTPVVEERVISKQVHEIIPQVYREHEIAEIRHALLPVHERVSENVTYSEARLEGVHSNDIFHDMRPEEIEKTNRIKEEIARGAYEELPTEHQYRYYNPVVHEIIKPRIIHEVHPIIKREVERAHIIREILPVYERVVDSAKVSDEVEVLRSMSLEDWERGKISGKGPEERYSRYWYRTPPRSPVEGPQRSYASPEREQRKETRPTTVFGEGGHYHSKEYRVLEPGYSARVYGGESEPGLSRHVEGVTQGASHLVHPVGHEAEPLHRLSPVHGYTVKDETVTPSYLSTPVASPMK